MEAVILKVKVLSYLHHSLYAIYSVFRFTLLGKLDSMLSYKSACLCSIPLSDNRRQLFRLSFGVRDKYLAGGTCER